MYKQGKGVPQSYIHAHLWSNLAAAQGQKDGVKRRDELRSLMTTEQVAEAQKLATDLFERINSTQSD